MDSLFNLDNSRREDCAIMNSSCFAVEYGQFHEWIARSILMFIAVVMRAKDVQIKLMKII